LRSTRIPVEVFEMSFLKGTRSSTLGPSAKSNFLVRDTSSHSQKCFKAVNAADSCSQPACLAFTGISSLQVTTGTPKILANTQLTNSTSPRDAQTAHDRPIVHLAPRPLGLEGQFWSEAQYQFAGRRFAERIGTVFICPKIYESGPLDRTRGPPRPNVVRAPLPAAPVATSRLCSVDIQ
jgi:hypothetical protein